MKEIKSQAIKKQEKIYQKEYQKFRDMVHKEEQKRLIPYAKTFLGKCYKFKNSYGAGDDWWLYLKVVRVDKTNLFCLTLQTTSHGIIEIKPEDYNSVWNRENPFSGYLTITDKEFEEQRKGFITLLKNAGKK